MKHRITGGFIAILMLISSSAWAQMGSMMGGDTGMHGMMGMHDKGMGMDGGMMEMMKMMGAVSGLDLTPDQKKKIQMLKLSHQKEAIPLFSRIRMSGVEMEELLLQDPVDMTKVKDKINEKYDAMAKLEVSHLALKQQIRSILTPEQRQRMESMMMGMMNMMDMGSMMGGPSGKAPQAAPGTPAEPAPKSTDPHGH